MYNNTLRWNTYKVSDAHNRILKGTFRRILPRDAVTPFIKEIENVYNIWELATFARKAS